MMKPFTCNGQDITYQEFMTQPRSRQNGTELYPFQSGSCNHHFNSSQPVDKLSELDKRIKTEAGAHHCPIALLKES